MQRPLPPVATLLRPCRLALVLAGAALLIHAAGGPARAAADPTLLPSIVGLVRESSDPQFQLDVLRGLSAAYQTQPSHPMPAGWSDIESRLGSSTNRELRSLVRLLSLKFGSPAALAALRRTVEDRSAAAAERRVALASLIGVRAPGLTPVLQGLVADPDLRGEAIRALGGVDDPATPKVLLAAYPKLDPAQKRDVLTTLAGRRNSAGALLDAVEAGTVSARELSAEVLRQLRKLQDPAFQTRLTRVYGVHRESPADKQKEIDRYKRIFQAGGSTPGDAPRGRVVFNRVCVQCHTLFDTGGRVGPDITGANRADLDYLLQNILDPNAVIPNEYRSADVETRDGRSLTGIIRQQDDKVLILQTANDLVSLRRSEVASTRPGELSMMPEGLVANLSDQEVRDLLYYLMRPGQVPLPAGAK